MTVFTNDSEKVFKLVGIRSKVRNQLFALTIVVFKDLRWRVVRECELLLKDLCGYEIEQ